MISRFFAAALVLKTTPSKLTERSSPRYDGARTWSHLKTNCRKYIVPLIQCCHTQVHAPLHESSDVYSLKSQIYPTYIQKLLPSPKFTPFSSIINHFRVTGVFETSAPNYCKMTLSTKRSNVLHIHISATFDSQFSLFLLYGVQFSSYMPFWGKCTEWPQNDLEH